MSDRGAGDRPVNRNVFLACAIPGLAIMGYGVFGLIQNAGQTQPTQWARWFIGGLVVHDFLVAPLVFLTAIVVIRRIPQPWKAPVQGALVATGIIVLATWPWLAGYGRRPDNPTLLPNNYAAGLAVVVAVIWATAAAAAFWKWKARASRK